MTWIDVNTQMPALQQTVLVAYKNSQGLLRRVRAKWVPAATQESNMDSDIGEYSEDDDTYYDPEGWYEQIDNWDEYTAVVISYTVTHWVPLPEFKE